MSDRQVTEHPAAKHRPGRRHHRCSVCGKEAPWDARWRWFGSYKDTDDGKPVTKICSVNCYETVSSKLVPRPTREEHIAWTKTCALSDDAAAVLHEIASYPGQYPSEVALVALAENVGSARFRDALAELELAGLVERRAKRKNRHSLHPVETA